MKFIAEVVHLANWPHKQVVVDGAGPVLDLDGRGQVLQVGRLTFRFQLRLQQLGQDVVDVVGLRRCPASTLETRRFVSVESILESLPFALKDLDFRFQAPIEDRVGLVFLKNGFGVETDDMQSLGNFSTNAFSIKRKYLTQNRSLSQSIAV